MINCPKTYDKMEVSTLKRVFTMVFYYLSRVSKRYL